MLYQILVSIFYKKILSILYFKHNKKSFYFKYKIYIIVTNKLKKNS